MSAGSPWSVKGINPKAREIAKDLARRSGMTLGEWLNRMILEDDLSFLEEDYQPPRSRPSFDSRRGGLEPPASRLSRYEVSADRDEVARLAAALERLSSRIEACEHRQSAAITGIDQSVRGVLARIEDVERETGAVAEDLRLDQARIRRLEQGGAGGGEQVRALADQLHDHEARTREALARLQPAAGEASPSLLHAMAERLTRRLEAAEAKTADALMELSGSFLALDERMRGVEGGAVEQRLSALAADLTRRMEDVRAEMAARLHEAAGGSLTSFDTAVAAMTAHVDAAEKRSAEAIDRMGREVLSMAGAMNRRVGELEDRTTKSLDEMGGEIARLNAGVEQRLAFTDNVHAQALERLGGEIARITERLSERISRGEERNARAIDDVGEQVARLGDRLTERQERTTSEFSERIRQSEERTARFLEEARGTIESSLGVLRAREDEPAVAPTFETPVFEAPVFEATAVEPPASVSTTPSDLFEPLPESFAAQAPEPAADEPNDFDARYSFSEGADPAPARAPLTSHVFAPPSQAFSRIQDPAPADRSAVFDDDLPYVSDEPDSFLAASDDDAYDLDTLDLSPDDAPAPLRILSTREAVEQARAAARAANAEPEPRIRLGDSHARPMFAFMGGRKSRARMTMLQTVACLVGGGVALTLGSAGLILSSNGPAAAGDEAPVDRTAPAPSGARAASALSAAAPIATPMLDGTMGAAFAGQYQQAAQQIEAGDAAGVAAMRQAAEQGYAPAQFYLSRLYKEGGLGVKADAKQARLWVERAAKGGEPKAMQDFGFYLFNGVGGPEDVAAAVPWFKRAAELGEINSQFNLGQMHEKGLGVAQNDAEAYKWYLIAARGGDDEARSNAAQIRAKLSADAQRAAERSALGFRPAAAVGAQGFADNSADNVVTAQKALSRLGYYQGPQDGVWSPALRLALASYQQHQGFSASDKLDSDVVAHLAAFAQ